MKADIQAKVETYLDLLAEIKEKVGDEQTAARLLTEVAKDVRMDQIREERENHAQPASTKQLQFLKKLGVQHEEGISKTEASRLIDDELGRNGDE